jgi:hypothetical protein
LLYSRVGAGAGVGAAGAAGAAGAPEPHQNFYPEPEPHKNDAAPQHWSEAFKLFNSRCAGKLLGNTGEKGVLKITSAFKMNSLVSVCQSCSELSVFTQPLAVLGGLSKVSTF